MNHHKKGTGAHELAKAAEEFDDDDGLASTDAKMITTAIYRVGAEIVAALDRISKEKRRSEDR